MVKYTCIIVTDILCIPTKKTSGSSRGFFVITFLHLTKDRMYE